MVTATLVWRRYEESGDGLAVTFSSPSGEESSSVSAKVLIGADGAFSRVRKQCLDDGKPDASVRLLRVSTSHVPTGIVCTSRVFFLLPPDFLASGTGRYVTYTHSDWAFPEKGIQRCRDRVFVCRICIQQDRVNTMAYHATA